MPDDTDPNDAAQQAAAQAAEAAAAQAAELAATRDQLTATQQHLTAATTDLRAALQTAHPDLPETAFAGDDIAAIKASVTSARAVADHVLAAKPATPPAPAATPAGGGTTREPLQAPEGTRGLERIKFGLTNREK